MSYSSRQNFNVLILHIIFTQKAWLLTKYCNLLEVCSTIRRLKNAIKFKLQFYRSC